MRSRVPVPLLPFLFIALLSSFPGRGQDLTAAQRKAAIAEHKAHIARADSIGDAGLAVQHRLLLAPLLSAVQARPVLEMAAAMADSAALPGDEVLRAHQALMDLYIAQGNWRKAFQESRSLMGLQTARHQQALDEAVASGRSGLSLATVRHDSLATTWRAEQAALVLERDGLHTAVQRWQLIAMGLLVVAVVVGIAVARKSGKQHAVLEARLRQLAEEVEVLRTSSATGGAPAVPSVAVVEPVDAPPEHTLVPPPAEEDELLRGMFRKQAPERLQALRAARAAGDLEKVKRVVSTLRPQVFALDEKRFAPLHTFITAPDAALDPVAWNAALDRYEKAVEEQLAR